MSNNNLTKLIGRNYKSIQSQEAHVLGNHSLKKIINYFKRVGFGVLTLQGIDIPKSKSQKIEVKKFEIELQRLGLNYIKFQGRWLINFKEPVNTREISFFIMNPSIKTMSLLARQYNQGTFIFSENGDHNLYYMDGYKIMLEKDDHTYGEIIDDAYLLKCKDFKFIYDKTLDLNFQFIDKSELSVGDFILVEQFVTKGNFESFEMIKVDDVRQNAVINFFREQNHNTIEPFVYQFDEMKYMIRLQSANKKEIDFHLAQAV